MTTPPQSKWSNSIFFALISRFHPRAPGRSFVFESIHPWYAHHLHCNTRPAAVFRRCWSGLIELVFRCRQWAARKLSWDHHLSGPAKLFQTFPKYDLFQTSPAGKGNSVYCWWMGGTIFRLGLCCFFSVGGAFQTKRKLLRDTALGAPNSSGAAWYGT